MTLFVINLARRTDRLARMKRQLSDFERLDAMDGNRKVEREGFLTEDGCGSDVRVARFRFWCAKGYGVRPGEIGCLMSHRKAWRSVLNRGLDVACILEDDVTLAPDFRLRAETLASQLRTAEPTVVAFAATTAGYLINRAGAELMLRLTTPIRSTADDWARWRRGGLVWRRVVGLLAVPPYGDPAATGIAKSDIIGDARHFVANMSFGRKAFYRCGRAFGKAVDFLWR